MDGLREGGLDFVRDYDGGNEDWRFCQQVDDLHVPGALHDRGWSGLLHPGQIMHIEGDSNEIPYYQAVHWRWGMDVSLTAKTSEIFKAGVPADGVGMRRLRPNMRDLRDARYELEANFAGWGLEITKAELEFMRFHDENANGLDGSPENVLLLLEHGLTWL